jgi:hypothetical protein
VHNPIYRHLLLAHGSWFLSKFHRPPPALYRSRFWGKHFRRLVGLESERESKGVQLKVICGTSSYDYGTLTYVEEMFL